MNLHKFVGTWQWTAEQDTFTIVFNKDKYHYENPHVHVDLILGWHKYVKGGQVIENFLDQRGSSFEQSTFNGKTDENPNTLELSFKDSKGEFIHDATFKIVAGHKNQAILTIEYSSGVYVGKSPKKDGTDIPIPNTWKMKRIRK